MKPLDGWVTLISLVTFIVSTSSAADYVGEGHQSLNQRLRQPVDSDESVRYSGDVTSDENDSVLKLLPRSIPDIRKSGGVLKLQRRGENSRYTDEMLEQAGLAEKQAARFRRGQLAIRKLAETSRANAEADRTGRNRPFSEDYLIPVRSEADDYAKLRALVDARLSGDSSVVEQAERALQSDRESHYTDQELKTVLTKAQIARFKETRASAVEWSTLVSNAREEGRELWDAKLTPEQRRIQEEAAEHSSMLRTITQRLAESKSDVKHERRGPTSKEAELKRLLNLEQIAEVIKGRRAQTRYNSIMQKRRKARMTGGELPAVSDEELDELRKGVLKHKSLLELLKRRRAQLAANPERFARVISGSLDTKEEQKVKGALTLEEIFDYVNGREAEHDLELAEANNEAARRAGLSPPVSQEAIGALKLKVRAYRELQDLVEGRRERVSRSRRRQAELGQQPSNTRKVINDRDADDIGDHPDVRGFINTAASEIGNGLKRYFGGRGQGDGTSRKHSPMVPGGRSIIRSFGIH